MDKFGFGGSFVVNQKNAPAIWESDINDFPDDLLPGRILINTTNGAIYLDGVSTRVIISNGSNTFLNGLTSLGGTATNRNIGFGGSINQDTVITVDTGKNFSVTEDGANTAVQYLAGGMVDADTGKPYVVVDLRSGSIVPNTVIAIYNPIDGKEYLLNAFDS